MEVLPGVHKIAGQFGNRNLFLYLLTGERTILLDTGIATTPESDVFPYLRSIGKRPEDIDIVVCMHSDADHVGGLAALRKAAPGALLMCHELDQRWVENPDLLVEERYNQFAAEHGIAYEPEVRKLMRDWSGAPTQMDILLKGGETLRVSDNWRVRILHTPGHTWGHLTVHDPTNNWAFISDAVLYTTVPDSAGTATMPPTYQYLEGYRPTIDTIERLNLDRLFTAHYADRQGQEVRDFLAASRSFLDRVTDTVLGLLRDGPMTMRELCEAVNPLLAGKPGGYDYAYDWAFPLIGHMEELERRRKVVRERKGNLVAWRLA